LQIYYFEPKELREINRLQEIDKRAQEEKKQLSILGNPLTSLDPTIVSLLTTIFSLGFNQNPGRPSQRNMDNGGYQMRRPQT
jgi:hypothetical protein